MSGTVDYSFQKPISGTIAALNATVDLTSPNSATTVVQILSTWTGTLVVEGSNDGTNYSSIQSFNDTSMVLSSSITANGTYISNTNGYQFYRIRASAWTSGTANISGYGSDSPSYVNTETILMGSSGNIVDVSNSPLTTTGYGLVVRSIPKIRQTYAVTAINITPANTATDVFTITGSNTKTVYVHKVSVTGTKTAHSHETIVLLKRSTANTGGTSATPAIVPYDSNNDAATAVVRSYTANPTVGTLVGNIYSARLSLPVQTPTNAQGNGGSVAPWVWEYKDNQPIILRGNTQVLAVNHNSVTFTGGNLQYSIEWSEE